MDRSFLSHPEVVAASRRFVCARLATYEDASEVELLTSIYSRRGKLQNSVFCILSPKTNEKLTRSGRSPRMVFDSAEDMARSMHELAAEFKPRDSEFTDLGLPYLADVRLALNVAACDAQPLIVVHAPRDTTPKNLVQLAWKKPSIGNFLYAHTTKASELAKISGASEKRGIYFVAPNAFGTAGKAVVRLPLDAGTTSIRKAMEVLREQHLGGAKSSRDHIREARRKGIRWKTATPVTDDHAQARGRGRE